MPTSRDATLDEILAYVQLDDDDRARLTGLYARLAAQLPAIAQRFYERLAANPGAAAMLSKPDQVRRLHASLVDWMTSGLLGPYDEQFHEARAKIGRRHVAVRLPQHYMFAAMSVIRCEYDDRIAACYAPDEASRVAKSVNKLLDIELALMLRHYQLDSETKLVARERRGRADRVAALQTLSSGLAHELRNPLNSAKLQLELLERRLRRNGDDPKLTGPLGLAHHEIERLSRLLNEFLAFARPPDLALGEHDAVALIREVIASERALADARGATIELVAPEPVVAYIDATKLQQIVQHLIRNAVEAVHPGGRVAVALHGDDDQLYVRVDDDGPGIPEAVQRRIYEPFFSTKESGTGLGLAIVHSMVTLHGGTIEIASTANGTRFEVAMPRRA
jgi:signal transduction histidine kinase